MSNKEEYKFYNDFEAEMSNNWRYSVSNTLKNFSDFEVEIQNVWKAKHPLKNPASDFFIGSLFEEYLYQSGVKNRKLYMYKRDFKWENLNAN